MAKRGDTSDRRSGRRVWAGSQGQSGDVVPPSGRDGFPSSAPGLPASAYDDTIEIRRDDLSIFSQDAPRFAEAVRGHWGIEHSVHWMLDVVFHEEACRIRHGHAPENVAVLRHIALNALSQAPSCRRGIGGKRKNAGWNDHYLAQRLFPTRESDAFALETQTIETADRAVRRCRRRFTAR